MVKGGGWSRERKRSLKLIMIMCVNLQKVNTQLKRSDNELAKLNSIMEQISKENQTFASNIEIEVPSSPKKSSSPLLRKLRQQQGKVPRVPLPKFLRNPSHDSSSGVEEKVAEAEPQARGDSGSAQPTPS